MALRTVIIVVIAFLYLSIVFPLVAGQQSQWITEGDSLNIAKSKETGVAATPHALAPSLTIKGELPYVAWSEIDSNGFSRIYVKHKAGKEWVQDGGALNISPARHAGLPVLTSAGNKLYAVWSEKDAKNISQVYVKQWDGEKWTQQGGSLNINPLNQALNPVIAGSGQALYAAWSEVGTADRSLLYIKQWDGSSWKQLGDRINESPDRHAMTPSLAADKNGVYLAWAEYDEQNISQVYVSHWDGEKWEDTGKPVNIDTSRNALSPSVSVTGGNLYIAWMEYNVEGASQIYVKRWNGKEWTRLGGSLNIDQTMHGTNPSLAMKGDTPYVAWEEISENGISDIKVKHWGWSAWAYDGSSLTGTEDRTVTAPSLAINSSAVYVAFSELDSSNIYKLYVKRVEGKGVTGIITSSLKQTEPSALPKEKTSNTFFTRIPLDLSKMPPSPVAVKVIPKTGMGEIDWMKGIKDGLFKPFDSTDPDARPYVPLANMDMKLPIKRDFGLPDARFPHSSHTMWLDCKNCHPTIFAPKRGGNPITMHRVIEGEFCGKCHGVVAFRIFDCFRCHSPS